MKGLILGVSVCLQSLVNSIDDAQLALDIYFYILSILCCILLFFATSVSLKY